MTERTTRPRPAAPRAPRVDGIPGHVPPPPNRERALLGVDRAAAEVTAAQRRLARTVDVALAAGATEEEVEARAAAASSALPVWMPDGGGPRAFGG